MLKALMVTAICLLPGICSGQTANNDNPPSYTRLIPKPFVGTLVSVADDKVTLVDKSGKTFVVLMTPHWTVSVNRPTDASAIKPGDFIATTNTPVDATTGKAIELRILEPGYQPELGTHPYAPGDPKMMTHATVTSVRKSDLGTEVDVSAPDGARRIIVPPGVPVVASDPVPRTSLKPGDPINGVTRTDAQGVARASRLQPSLKQFHKSEP